MPPFRTPGPLRLGTRGSPLALAQTDLVMAALVSAHGMDRAGILAQVVRTAGDRIQDRPLAEIGGKALWTRELDAALLEGEAEAAVHSLKDVESPIDPRFVLAAVLPRADVADRLIGAPAIEAIPAGALVGTSSPRRAAQILRRRPDLRVVPLRGNVATRMRKVADGEAAATFLAAAGLDRLAIRAGVRLDPQEWLPAASQGAVGVVCRADDAKMIGLLAPLDHAPTRAAVLAERAFLDGVGGNCHSAIGAYAAIGAGGLLRATGRLWSPDGSMEADAALVAEPGEAPEVLGRRLAAAVLAAAPPGLGASLAGR